MRKSILCGCLAAVALITAAPAAQASDESIRQVVRDQAKPAVGVTHRVRGGGVQPEHAAVRLGSPGQREARAGADRPGQRGRQQYGQDNGRRSAVAPARAAALCETVTIDLDTTDVEVYGRKKRGVAFNHQGRRVGRPHVATWADTATVLAADLMSGRDDPRRHVRPAPRHRRRA